MWQNNISWVEGLFSEIPFNRFQEIRTESNLDSSLVIFTRLNPNKGNDWANLKIEGVQSPTSPLIKTFDISFNPDNYYIVEVDIRLRKTILSINIESQDFVPGRLSVIIEYQVANLKTLLSISDPLARFKDTIGEFIVNYVSQHAYESVSEIEIRKELRLTNKQSKTGISIQDASGIHIQWADSANQKLQQSIADKINDKTKKLNDLKIEKLDVLGIHDPILIASVLSQSDADFEVIMEHVRKASQAYKNQIDRDLSLLIWLKEKDLLTRYDVQNVIDSLIGKIDDKASQSSPLLKGLLDVNKENKDKPNNNSNQKEIQSEMYDQDDPPLIGKRKINLPNNSNQKEIQSKTNNQDGPSLIEEKKIYFPNKISSPEISEEKLGAEGNSEYEIIKKFQFSAAHPIIFSKRFESIILCQLYMPENRSRALKNIKLEFQEQRFDEKVKQSFIKLGQKVTVQLDGNNFSFSEPVTKTINDKLNKFVFIVKPNDNCEVGYHKIKASVIDTITGEEFDYLILNHVRVVDFAFDHVSRPLLSRASAIVLGLGSFAMFLLTFFEQIDKTLGLTSGTAAGVLALGIYVSFYNLYQRVYPNTS